MSDAAANTGLAHSNFPGVLIVFWKLIYFVSNYYNNHKKNHSYTIYLEFTGFITLLKTNHLADND